MSVTERPFPPPHLTPEQNLRKEAFVMALQALAAGRSIPTTQEVEAEAERFLLYLNK